ncbi:glycoside hydrolase [Caldisericum exile]|uniref:Glycoside hydrolase n=1 Tax=Caldisericum exile (strain DSM 21853 / NBRC 104410 / AZM16c01) TaxID=511051 RepID=A0A7U6JF25_CALEA|nr:glycoside hydrolase [Caldisericum exile]BAL81033.1 putative glycoside hydrolase [Caldisericum exile AZM16c01]
MQNKLFLWLHMHQPDYLDSLTGKIILPWVRRHALNGYYSVPSMLLKSEFKANINFSGILIEQIKQYQDGEKDVYQVYEDAEPESLSESEINFIFRRFKTPYSFKNKRFDYLKEKFSKGEKLSSQEILDFQVIFKLSAFAQIDEEIIELRNKGMNFTKQDKEVLINLEKKIIHSLFDIYKELIKRNQIEITVTPYYHPIIPLLLDLNSAVKSKKDAKIPNLQSNLYEDAKIHIDKALSIGFDTFNIQINGMWPAEGSISEETVILFKNSKIKWIGSDETLVRSLGLGQGVYNYKDVTLFLRNHSVSDKIGFMYNKMKPSDAVADLKHELEKNGNLILILDGENPWEYFENYGANFMEELFKSFSGKETLLGSEAEPIKEINYFVPGSWINGHFDTWIGDEETNTAWTYLIETRKFVNNDTAKEFILKAQASDHFWWYSDFHKNEINFDFDYLFRGHLIKALLENKIDVKPYLYYPIKSFP